MSTCPHCSGEHGQSASVCEATGLPLSVRSERPRRIDRYQLDRRLGRGGFGSVYSGHHVHTRRRVAIKLLKAPLTAEPQMVARFKQEARALAAVKSDRVVEVLDWGVLPTGESFLVMELLEGQNLLHFMNDRGGRLDVAHALGLLRQLLEALEEVHAAGVVHRDLKPSNIFVTERDGAEFVQLVDFGISKVPRDLRGISTSGGATRLGTPGFMAPEQLFGESDVRVDIFAAGVVAYRMFSGRLPWPAADMQAYARQVTNDDPQPLAAVAPVSDGLSRIIMRALDPDPDGRWEDARAFTTALDELERHGMAKTQLASQPLAVHRATPTTNISEPPGPPTTPLAPADVLAALNDPPPKRPPADTGWAGSGNQHASDDVASDRARTLVKPPREPSADTAKTTSLRRPLQGWRVAAAALAVVGGVGIGWQAREAQRALMLRDDLVTALQPPPTTTLLDLANSPIEGPAAGAYRRGVLALRNAAWGQAEEAFAQAVEIDPELAEAHMRLARITATQAAPPTRRREMAQQAIARRDRLTSRDRALLHALEPLLLGTEPDLVAFNQRIAEALLHYPGDAELHTLAGGMLSSDTPLASQQAHLERAVAIDPGYADAWNLLGRTLSRRGRADAALAAFDHCIRVAPVAEDCHNDRAGVLAATGACDAAARASADGAAVTPEGRRYPFHAFLVAGQGKSRTAVDAVLDNEWKDGLGGVALRERRDIFFGDFAAAERSLRALVEATPASHEARRLLVELLWETGRDAAATDMARIGLENLSSLGEAPTLWVAHDARMPLWAAQLRAGGIDEAALTQARREFLASWERRGGAGADSLWLVAWGETSFSAEAAKGALAALAKSPGSAEALLGPAQIRWGRSRYATVAAHLGRIELLAGNSDAAVTHLASAAAACPSFDAPFHHVRLHAWHGEALEAAGREGACDAYGRVLARWSDVPTSRTARAARAARVRLACP